jgi:CheY-like chemotaxis protein
VPVRPAMISSAEVLVVEDDGDLRDELVDCLVSAGHSTLPAGNGKEALALLAGNRLVPSLIVLDLSMPIMDGRELLDLLRSYRRLAAIPVILITGRDPGELARYPGVTLLKKPFTLQPFLAAVEHCLGA